MLPPFDEHGNLPEGVHQATESVLLARFVGSSVRRTWLGERLSELLHLVQSTGVLGRFFLWGSFVTAKTAPNDLDVLLVMSDDFDLDRLPASLRDPFDHTRARLRFNADVFWTKAGIGPEMLGLWLDTYQTGRDFRRRGIVEVVSK